MDLFSGNPEQHKLSPLADRLRPQDFSQWLYKLTNKTSLLDLLQGFKNGKLFSLILWGPPGCGKTSLAKVIANECQSEFIEENAIDLGAVKIRGLCESAKRRRLELNQKTILFVDEIHRLNKSQQDVFLPYLEKGYLYLLGATTENPSYELNRALVSRCRLIVLEPLDSKALETIYQRACASEDITTTKLLDDKAQAALIAGASGDARKLLNQLEELLQLYDSSPNEFPLDTNSLDKCLSESTIRYDKKGDEHYDVISAFIKSIRGSDPDAAVYYLARMLAGGEDPKFIARRMVILASEDIGNADPRALSLATATMSAVEMIGLPEARINLSQCVCYLASAPKSNSSYQAINRAQDYVKQTGALPVPKHLRSAQTQLMKSIGHGKGYKYSHEGEKGWRAQDYLPDSAKDQQFYNPSSRGFEKNITDYLKWMRSK